MAFKLINTTSAKVSSIDIQAGQLICSRDDRTIYVDSSTGRTVYKSIIELETDAQRTALTYPLNAFYFVEETKVLWRYDDGWTALTTSPKQQILFASKSEFPEEGDSDVLYVDGIKMYRWLGRYVDIATGGCQWQELII